MSHIHAVLPADCESLRLDRALAQSFPQYSRSFWQKHLREGLVLVDGIEGEADDRCVGGEVISADIADESDLTDLPQNIPLQVVAEDEDLLVINKPARFTVHPGNGQRDGTLLNALLFHRPALARVARAGIVHRLDKDTSGIMMVAKNAEIRLTLVEMIANREVSREYLALVKGQLGQAVGVEGTISAPVGRHPKWRTQMAVLKSGGKPAVTHYRVLKHFVVDGAVRFSWVHCRLQTGRTHQIRVHLTHLGHPLVGDALYRGESRHRADLLNLDKQLSRQALHAFYLGFNHPRHQLAQSWQLPLPEDLQNVLNVLKNCNK